MSYMLSDKKVSDLILDSDFIIQGTVKEFLESESIESKLQRGKIEKTKGSRRKE